MPVTAFGDRAADAQEWGVDGGVSPGSQDQRWMLCLIRRRATVTPMRPLRDVIVAVRRELEAALEANGKSPSRTQLDADRIVVTLDFDICQQTGAGEPELSFGVVAMDVNAAGETGRKPDRAKTHTVTIEFKSQGCQTAALHGVAPAAATGQSASEGTSVEERTRPEYRVGLLAQVFGAPGGFYSHNRADVLLSAVGELTDRGYDLLLGALAGNAPPTGDADVAQAYGQICNILRSGPAGSVVKGAALLREALTGIGRSELKRVVETAFRNDGRSSDLVPDGARDAAAGSNAKVGPLESAAG